MRNAEVMDLIENLVPGELSPEQALVLLGLEDEELCQALFDRAYAVKSSVVGRVLYLRGIIEYSNICAKNCHYCGIRRDNRAVERYRLDEDEIVQSALWAREHRLGSVVIQGGERSDRECVDFVERVVARIKTESNGELGITLSLGEQSLETYQRWFAAGAHRYLLRIESSDPELYRRLHPPTMI
jgi:biotin synthase